MDAEKAALLFGELPDWADPDDPDDRTMLLAEHSHIHDAEWLGSARGAVLEVVANQIAGDNPPQVWQTAQRLLATGLDRRQVLQQLVLALHQLVLAMLEGDAEFDREAYGATLAGLPVPDGDDVAAALITTVRAQQPVAADDLERLVAEQLGTSPEDPLVDSLIDRVVDQFLADPASPVTLLIGDVVVHVESFTTGIVLTHRLSDTERDYGILDLGADLAGFGRYRALRLPDGTELVNADDEERHWAGPQGWLDDLPTGTYLAIRIDHDGTVHRTVLDHRPVPSDELVELLRAVYDDAVAQPWLPVGAEDLVLGMLVRRPQAFAEPAAPLSELARAAGLEQREHSFAHEESVWQRKRRLRRDWRVIERLGGSTEEAAWMAVRVLHLLDDAPPLDPGSAREVLAGLYEPDVLGMVADELLGLDDDPELLTHTGVLSNRLLAVASTPDELTVAHWLAALVAERRGDLPDAESHLRVAVRADPGWWSATDRLAWYRSDRGDAAGALELWQQFDVTAEDSDEVRIMAPFAATPVPRLGRNQPCWCGSGRKFKTCHLGRPILAPLPDRAGWLYRKATGYLRRRGGGVLPAMIDHTLARAVDQEDQDSLREALHDPLVCDVVLHEGGWFERFLAERGSLLPDDEVVLGRNWTRVARTGYELLDVGPDGKATLRDLRTGEDVEVRARSLPGRAQVGLLLCGRAVPDGESHLLLAGTFAVPPGDQPRLFDLLDKGDGTGLLDYVAELHQPPDRPEDSAPA